ncbi:hypothetical protein F2P79_025772, partial [Pimephales promelas]
EGTLSTTRLGVVRESVEQSSEAALGMDVENVNRQWTFGLRKLIERKEKIPREFMELFDKSD